MRRVLPVSLLLLAAGCPAATPEPLEPATAPADAGSLDAETAPPDAAAPEAAEPDTALGEEALTDAGTDELPPPPPAAGFLGGDDEALLGVLCEAEPLSRELNRGGTTFSFRYRFEDDLSALYKPEQAITHSHWEGEVAAYRLSRLLGIHSVPPSCPRHATRDELFGADGVTLDTRRRLEEQLPFDAEGGVDGMAMYWVPELRDEPLELGGDWEGWLAQGSRLPAQRVEDAAALSDMLLLDWLTLNGDRWTGGNIRRQGSSRGPIVLIDNAAGFGTNPWDQTARVWPSFQLAQRFRVSVVDALRAADDETLRALLGDVLSEEQLAGLFDRRDRALARIDDLAARFGADKVFCFE